MHIPGWLVTREMLVNYSLAILTTVISLYAGEVRQFLSLPGRKFRKRRIDGVLYKILLLTSVRNNPYRLLRFLLGYITEMLLYICGSITVGLFYLEGAKDEKHSPQFLLWSLVGPILIVRLWVLSDVADGLHHFDQKIRSLKERLKALGAEPPVWDAIRNAEQEVAVLKDPPLPS